MAACLYIYIYIFIIDVDFASSQIHDRVAGLAGTQFLTRLESRVCLKCFFGIVQYEKPIKSNWQ